MKKALLFFLTLCICFINSSCAKTSKDKGGYTFTDDLGNLVNVSKNSRTATLLGSFADMWILSGGNVCATADDAWNDFNLSLSNETVNLGKTHSPNIEKIFESNPDFVIASSKSAKHIEMKTAMENAGITVAYFDVTDFDSFCRVLEIFTNINERPDLYDIYVLSQKEKIDRIISESKGKESKKVLVLRASASSVKAKNSNGTVLGKMLFDLGCTNIADSNNMILDDLSIESISESNPEMIFIVQMGDKTEETKKAIDSLFSENPLWKELDAVKNSRIYYMDKRLYNLKPNAYFAEAYDNLNKILYEK